MAHLMWFEIEPEDLNLVFRRFGQIAAARGHRMTPIPWSAEAPIGTWIDDADAFIVRTTLYLEYEELGDAFRDALKRGKRVLWIARESAKVNPWLERSFDIAIVDDVHFDLTRWRSPDWADRRDKDRLVARPASASARLDSLLAGVERLVVERPNPVRVFGNAQPLLDVAVRDMVTSDDLPLPRETISSDDEAHIAAAFAPPGRRTAQALVLGDGACLVDEYLDADVADNVRFAENVVDWLAGATSPWDLAQDAKRHLDDIELTLWEVALQYLKSKHGDDWPSGIPPSRLDKVRQLRPGDDLALTFDLADKVEVVRAHSELRTFYQPSGESRTQAKSTWSRLIRLRHRVAHASRLAAEPVLREELEAAAAQMAALDRQRRSYFAALDDDPAG